MDELDKKAQKGLEEFRKKESFDGVKSSLDSMVDGLFDEPERSAQNEGSTPEKSKGKKWAIIAFVILALAAIGYMGYQDGSNAKSQKEIQKKTPKVLFAQYFKPMDDVTSDVSRGENDGVSPLKGMELYNLKKYNEAASVLLSSDDPEHQFYGAMSLLNSGNSKDALPLLERMKKSDSYGRYQDIISWYIALAYLSEENKIEAKKQLNSIAETKGYKSKEAKVILESF